MVPLIRMLLLAVKVVDCSVPLARARSPSVVLASETAKLTPEPEVPVLSTTIQGTMARFRAALAPACPMAVITVGLATLVLDAPEPVPRPKPRTRTVPVPVAREKAAAVPVKVTFAPLLARFTTLNPLRICILPLPTDSPEAMEAAPIKLKTPPVITIEWLPVRVASCVPELSNVSTLPPVSPLKDPAATFTPPETVGWAPAPLRMSVPWLTLKLPAAFQVASEVTVTVLAPTL